MSIEEEIKILENALSGALLAPSECAFVITASTPPAVLIPKNTIMISAAVIAIL